MKNKIINALNFYGINDKSYLNECLKCIDYLSLYKYLIDKVNNIIDILYNKKDYLLAKLWKVKDKKDLFGNYYHSYITNIIVLLGCKIHQENIIKYNLDDNQIKNHKKRVKEALTYDVYERGYDGIRISQMLWASYFINLRIIEVGLLQYELVDINPITNKKERCIKIHIPKNTKLDIKSVKESLNKSKSEIKKYFKLYNPKYYCESWLLSSKVLNLLDDDSNIVKFSKLFDITVGSNCIGDILNFVYGKLNCDDYNALQVDTSLQRKIKEELIKGVIIKIGIGKLKEDTL